MCPITVNTTGVVLCCWCRLKFEIMDEEWIGRVNRCRFPNYTWKEMLRGFGQLQKTSAQKFLAHSRSCINLKEPIDLGIGSCVWRADRSKIVLTCSYLPGTRFYLVRLITINCVFFKILSAVMSLAWCFDCCFLNFSLAGKQGQLSQILYTKRAALPHQVSAAPSPFLAASSSRAQGSPENSSAPSRVAPTTSTPNQSQAAVRAREFAAEIFRQSQGGGGGKGGENQKESEKNMEQREEGDSTKKGEEEGRPCLPQTSTPRGCASLPQRSEDVMSPASSSSSPSSPLTPSSTHETSPSEPGYVNYSRLHYRLQQPGAAEESTAGEKCLPHNLERSATRYKVTCFPPARFWRW